ncbi:hypothetical protein L6R29_08585 [Myxococcota bacterium]|nr:hypothetical protein [Myxococcota bacterium]
MRTRVEEIMDAVTTLSLSEQLELVSRLSSKLQSRFQDIEEKRSVWKGKTLEEYIEVQQIQAKPSLQAYRKELWPKQEGADEFTTFLEEQRLADKQRENS